MAVTIISSVSRRLSRGKKMVRIGINGTNLDLIDAKSVTLTSKDANKTTITVTGVLDTPSSARVNAWFNIAKLKRGLYDLNYTIAATTTTLARAFRIQ